MSQSNIIEGGTSDVAFKEWCFLLERGASAGVDFDLFNLRINTLTKMTPRKYKFSDILDVWAKERVRYRPRLTEPANFHLNTLLTLTGTI